MFLRYLLSAVSSGLQAGSQETGIVTPPVILDFSPLQTSGFGSIPS